MNDSFLNSTNVSYVAELFLKFKDNPKTIDKSWINFFTSLKDDELSILGDLVDLNGKKEAPILLMIFLLIKLYVHQVILILIVLKLQHLIQSEHYD